MPRGWKPVLPRNKPGRVKGCHNPKNSGKRKQLNPDWEPSIFSDGV